VNGPGSSFRAALEPLALALLAFAPEARWIAG